MKWLLKTIPAASFLFLISCKNNDKTAAEKDKTETKTVQLKEETVEYRVDSLSMKSYVVYDQNMEGKRPAILVVHEWWGLNDYAKRRARQLAEMGYIAMAVDMYGNGKMGNNPEEASKLATPFYQDPAMAKKHFDAALDKLKAFSQTDTAKLGAIGYCFGGGILLNLARMGEPLKGVVSFHGSLIGTPANKDLLTSQLFVAHGEADKFVPMSEVDQFKKQMDSIGASYTVKTYPGATHAFTNPDATEMGKKFNIPIEYNAAADSASWQEMKAFFSRIFK
jgi:dienelactone hydrolase